MSCDPVRVAGDLYDPDSELHEIGDGYSCGWAGFRCPEHGCSVGLILEGTDSAAFVQVQDPMTLRRLVHMLREAMRWLEGQPR